MTSGSHSGSAVFGRRPFSILPLLLLAALFPAAPLRAQDAPPGTVARVDGLDVSVEGGTAAGSGGASVAPSIFVVNGGVVTVHSGKAQMTLVGGGEVDICGPAKFTVLESGGALTIALNFGRLHAHLPPAATLRVFTPTIIATPLDIGGASRDTTVGLSLDDSLCVLASSGALKLEEQFSGESLIVPQAGEFFLAGGKLTPVAGAPGSCKCEATRAQVTSPPPPIPEAGLSASTPPVLQPRTEKTEGKASPPAESAAVEPDVELSVLAHANDAHPTAPAPKPAEQPVPPSSTPEYKIELPPMMFSVTAPKPPADPTADMALVIRYARVENGWQFTGHVGAPRLEPAAQHAPAAPAPQTTAQNAAAPEAPSVNESSPPKPPQGSDAQAPKKKRGFWSRLKHIFTG